LGLACPELLDGRLEIADLLAHGGDYRAPFDCICCACSGATGAAAPERLRLIAPRPAVGVVT